MKVETISVLIGIFVMSILYALHVYNKNDYQDPRYRSGQWAEKIK